MMPGPFLKASVTLLLMSLFINHAVADDEDNYITINNLLSPPAYTLSPNDIRTGSVTLNNIDFCVIATKNRDTNSKRRANFRFTVTQQNAFANQFELIDSNGNTLPLTVKIGSYYGSRGQVKGLNNLEQAPYNSPLQTRFKGGKSCSDGNYGKSRIQLSFNITPVELAAGMYTADLTVTATSKKRASSDLKVQIIVPPLVQITHLEDMALSAFTNPVPFRGMNLAYGKASRFCIFSNNGGFKIAASGQNGNGQYFLLKSSVGTTVPYKVFLGKNINSSILASPNNKYSFSMPITNCETNNNMIISLGVTTTDAADVQFGTYSDILTLLVEPQ